MTFVTVQFVSERMDYVSDNSGAVVSGSKSNIIKVREEWIFVRSIKSQSLDWMVVSKSNI